MAPTGQNFMKFNTGNFSENLLRICFKSDNSIRHLILRYTFILLTVRNILELNSRSKGTLSFVSKAPLSGSIVDSSIQVKNTVGMHCSITTVTLYVNAPHCFMLQVHCQSFFCFNLLYCFYVHVHFNKLTSIMQSVIGLIFTLKLTKYNCGIYTCA